MGLWGTQQYTDGTCLDCCCRFSKRPCINALDEGYPGYDTHGKQQVFEDCGGELAKENHYRMRQEKKLGWGVLATGYDSCAVRSMPSNKQH